jgi:hypothetical protein
MSTSTIQQGLLPTSRASAQSIKRDRVSDASCPLAIDSCTIERMSWLQSQHSKAGKSLHPRSLTCMTSIRPDMIAIASAGHKVDDGEECLMSDVLELTLVEFSEAL